MRKKMIAGNWKMHGSRAELPVLLNAIKQAGHVLNQRDVLVFPAFIHLSDASALLEDSGVLLGAQNLYLGKTGAFTGEVAGSMLAEYGCRYVLVGHSERRTIFKEDLALVAAKVQAALEAGLTPLLCIGETLQQRQAGTMEQVLKDQLDTVIEQIGIKEFASVMIAYEPIWAIGTGVTATPEQAQQAHQWIREYLAKYHPEVANSMRILYGGSVKADNAEALFNMPDIDGGLIGGASLKADSFLAICHA